MKSFARFFLAGFLAASFPAVASLLAFAILFGRAWLIAGALAALCAPIAYFAVRPLLKARRRKKDPSSPADAAVAPRTPLPVKILGIAAGIVCFTLLFSSATPRILGLPVDAGPFDRAKMEGLVAQVRNQKFSGVTEFYWMDVSGTPALFSSADNFNFNWKPVSGNAAPASATAKGYPNIWAERADDQSLKVVFWIRPGGHTPFSYGFAYSDAPLAPDGTPRDSLIFFSSGPNGTAISHPAKPAFDVPGLHLMKRIDAHWWEVYDDSDD